MSLEVHMAPAVIVAQGAGERSPSSAPASPEQRSPPSPGASVSPTGKPGQAPGNLSEEKLAATVSKLNKQTQQVHRDLQFVIDRQSGSVVVQVVDTQNKEVIRQIPSKDMMALRHQLEELSSLLFHTKA